MPGNRRHIGGRATAGRLHASDDDFVCPNIRQVENKRRDGFTGRCIVLFCLGVKSNPRRRWFALSGCTLGSALLLLVTHHGLARHVHAEHDPTEKTN